MKTDGTAVHTQRVRAATAIPSWGKSRSNGPGWPAGRVTAARVGTQFVLVALVSAAPWWFGAIQASVQVWLFAAVLIALACWLVHVLFTRQVTGGAWAVLPLVIALGYVVLQLLPLNRSALEVVSPAAARWRAELASPPAGPMERRLGLAAGPERQPLSLYPAATRRELARLLLATSVFTLAWGAFVTPRSQLWLCGTLAVVGAALAFFGFIQLLTWNGMIYWRVPLTRGGGPFGPFVNRNNAGGFLNLCLAGAVGVTVWLAGRRNREYRPAAAGGRRGPSRWAGRLTDVLADLDAPMLFSLSGVACIGAGVLCTLSRGAFLGMVTAAAVVILAATAARRRGLRSWAVAVALAAAVGLVGWIGMTDTVQDRLATLFDLEQISSHGLLPHWQDGLHAAAAFWPAGSGLGTYRYVYPPYQARLQEAWFQYAENQYVQALAEVGPLGPLLIVVMIGVVGAAGWRLVRRGPDRRGSAFGVAALFALASQVVHAFFDFGLSVPSNALLFALLCGAAVGGARYAGGPGRPAARPGGRAGTVGRWRPAVLLLLLGAGCCWGLGQVRQAAATETALRKVRLAQRHREPSAEEIAHLSRRLRAATGRNPDDAEAHLQAADLLIYQYRQKAFQRLRAGVPADVEDAEITDFTSPTMLHARLHLFARSGLAGELARLRGDLLAAEYLLPALKHLVLARRACPMLPQVHLGIAMLCGLVADPAGDRVHVQRARELAPGDPDQLYLCGLLDLQAGRFDAAWASWKQSLSLSPRHGSAVLRLVGPRLGEPGMIRRLLPDSPALLVQWARDRFPGPSGAAIREGLLARAAALLDQVEMPEEERCYLRGAVAALRQQYAEAARHYARAVELCPYEVTWRYELARVLQEQGRLDEAHRHARWCARLAPRDRRYRQLLEQIHEARLRQPRSS